nr:reverse transcriptase domain-containing protein [Tanacetum cinerariifolium]
MEKAFIERPQGALPSNTIPNPRKDVKVITTRSGMTLARPSVPPPNYSSYSSSKEVERDPKTTLDLLQEQSDIQIHKFLHMFKKLHFNINFAKALAQMPKYAKMLKDFLTNKEKLLELANTPLNENFSAILLRKLPEKLGDPRKFLIPYDFSELEECMALADLGASINLMPHYMWKHLMLPELVPTCMTLELANRSVAYPAGIAEDVLVQVDKMLKRCEDTNLVLNWEKCHFMVKEGIVLGHKISKSMIEVDRAKVDVIAKLPHPNSVKSWILLLQELDVIIRDKKRAKNLAADHLSRLETPHQDELEKNKITETFPLETLDDFKPTIQHQKRVNPKIHEVIKAEVIKLLDAGLIYPISNSLWVSHVHVVPKKGGMMVVTNDNNELILKRLEKTTFTYPYGTFAYLRMPFGLCNAPGTFQRCMVAIFHDMIEKSIDVFMDDFSIFRDWFSSCLFNLDKMLKRCEDTNLVLNWEKCHFMVKEAKITPVDSPAKKFDIEVRDKKGAENLTVDHLSRLENPHKGDLVEMEMNDNFSHESLNMIDLNADNETHGDVWMGVKLWKFLKLGTMVEVSNRGLKRILERTVGEHRAKWADKLDDALWAFRTAFKTPISCTPYRIMYEKPRHLPIELEHKAYWTLKWTNFDLKTVGDHRKVQLNELNELRDQAYENSLIYKEKTKKIHDSKIINQEFHVGDRVVLFKSRLKILSGKLKSCWFGPFTITEVFPYGTV